VSADQRDLMRDALKKIQSLQAKLATLESRAPEPIAIVGMGCRFPCGIDSPDAYWSFLREGRSAVRPIPNDRWDMDRFYDPDPAAEGKTHVRFANLLDRIEDFDPAFFRISPREATLMDPEQRLLLEVSWEAIERAGISPPSLAESETGVFIGATPSQFRERLSPRDLRNGLYGSTGTDGSVNAGRLSYFYGFTGPTVSVNAACASSLVVVDLAVQSLQQHRCNLALAGGAAIQLDPGVHISFSKAGMLSPDGVCRSFDAAANGYGRGEGCGIVVLKRLSDALRDGNPICAVILGSAVNHNGASAGLTVPQASSQQAVIRAALRRANLDPVRVGYIEAHGTATPLGDTIELRALSAVFGNHPDPLYTGTAKANLGHLEAAAGVAGLIRAVLILQNGEIPANPHFRTPNPNLDWSAIPIRIPAAVTPWTAPDRVAGVSSFGYSGTNAHVILAAPPESAPKPAPTVAVFQRKRYWPELAGSEPAPLPAAPKPSGPETVLQLVARLLQMDENDIDPNTPLLEIGADSLILLELQENLARSHNFSANLRDFFGPLNSVAAISARLDAPRTFPLTPAQRQLWLLAQICPEGSLAYNERLVVQLDGPLDPAALQSALQRVVDRHEALRITIDPSGESQSVFPHLAAVIHDSDSQAPFDLHRGPLFRAALVQTGPQRHILSLTAHHVIIDGLSFDIILAELARFYSAAVQNGPPPRLPACRQFREYVEWQSIQLASGAFQVQAEYWMDRLAAAPPLDLPTDRPSPADPDFLSGTVIREIDPALAQSLNLLARQNGCTAAMVYLAAYIAFLSRLTGQSDLVVGMAAAGRGMENSEGLVGYCSHLLPIRAAVDPQQSFPDFLAGIKQTLLDAYENQDFPYAEMLNRAAPGTEPPIRAVFNALALKSLPAMAGLTLSLPPDDRRFEHFDICLDIFDFGGRWTANWKYATALFDPATIDRWSGHFLTLLSSLSTSDPLFRLPLLSPFERRVILEDWNSAPLALPHATFPEFFEAQVARTPDSVALISDSETLTYRELNERANRLAHYLRSVGMGPGTRVAICIERSPLMIVAVFGVLKSGAAYLPLDPSHPPERRGFALEDSQATLLLTDPFDPAIAAMPHTNPAHLATPNDPAYIIYTSGSTGQPKGVVATHRNLVSTTVARLAYYPLPAERHILVSSLAYDFSVVAIFWPLFQGGALVLPAPATEKDIAALAALIARHRVTNLDCVPALFAALLSDAQSGQLDSLRTVTVGGDVVPPSLSFARDAHLPAAALYNEYGPTECSVWAIVQPVVTGFTGLRIPIGRPIPCTQAYILDRHLQPVPPGVPGELYLGGEGVTLGYLNRPELTAERFIPNPFGTGRIYRTGDICRHLSDGAIDYLGRTDHQVKIRGFRIELGEIESRLEQHPAISAAAVVAREDGPGGKLLVAYCVPPGIEASVLRAYLSQSLPDYMVPASFVFLDALPLTPNGKLDRKALPAPDRQSNANYRPPRSPREEILCEIFEEVLRLDRVGIDGNFFDLGGHSLLAGKLTARVRAALGVELPIRAVFESPTVESLAPRLENTALARPALVSQQRPERLPLSPAQQRLWFLYRMEGASSTYNIATIHRLEPDVDLRALEQALNEVIARHETLRTVFPEQDGTAYQYILPPESARLTLTCSSATPAELAETAIDLRTEIPIRAWLLPESVLFVLVHHIAADGWSIGPLFREFLAAYRSQPLAPLPVQYADYTLWQQQLLGSESDPESLIARQLAYWREALAGTPDEISLPTDRPRPSIASNRGGWVDFTIEPGLHAALKSLARESGTSLFMLLTAAWAALLSRLGAGTDIPIGTPVAGRNDRSLDGLVGFFVNSLVLRIDLSGDPTFRELLARVRKTALAAYDHQDVPFERLVELLHPSRSLSRHPLFQVMLTLEHATESGPEPVPAAVSKFDLTLHFEERNGLRGTLEYALDLFDPATAGTLAQRFVRLLEAAVQSPDVPLHQLDILSPEERRVILQEWNATAADYPRDLCVHQLFEAQVAKTPNAVALYYEDQTLTYAELNANANRIAHRLIALGARPETLVGLCVPRTPEMLSALLGILKSGAAYVPIDPAYPKARQSFIVEDTAMSIVIAPSHEVFVSGGFASNPNVPQDPRSPLCILYTSGSTGVPKGVILEHRNLVNYLTWAHSLFPAADFSGMALGSSVCFDLSLFEIFAPLTSGGAVVLAENLLAIPTLHARDRITFINTVPSAAAALLAVGGLPPSVRVVVTAGELLINKVAQEIYQTGTVERMYNCWGPCETTIHSSFYLTRPGATRNPPIGKPLINTQLYVLDDRLQLAPAGVVGEVCVAGEGVARGYWNRPELTASKFIPNPFGTGRLYRTGDTARWLPDGNLEFVARVDHQVKIRGFRVELGELESALDRHPSVQRAIVLAREDGPGGKQLVAYCVPPGPEPADLRAHLSQSLPDYMLPAAFVFLDAFPLSPNGKIDRKALPAPNRQLAGNYQPPRSPHEQILCEIFAEVLELPQVGIDDNFFELGGHSLLAIRLISRIRESLNIDLPIRALFEAPTVESLARFSSPADHFARVLPLRPRGSLPPLFCLPPATGIAWGYAGLLRELGPDRPVYGLQLPSHEDGSPVPPTLDLLARDFLALIRELQPAGPYHLLGWSLGGILSHTIACSLQRAGEQVAALVLMDSFPPLGESADLPEELERLLSDISRTFELDSKQIDRIARWLAHAPALLAGSVLDRFDGDVLLFAAMTDACFDPALWNPYLTGALEVHPIECSHWEMSAPANISQIGRILADYLKS
jgi:amino acid adenylation domain-containing protein